jgi:formate hydrogenlyase subunit 6/NADH:ubiquinone oxidoreductase subunit I
MAMRDECAKSLLKKPSTLVYPFEKYESIPGSRGKIVINTLESSDNKCIGCGLCIHVCPAFALEMIGKGPTCDMKWYAGRCVFCGECVDICPRSAITQETTYDLADSNQDGLIYDYKRKTNPEGNVKE